jgi:hypothetical protein
MRLKDRINKLHANGKQGYPSWVPRTPEEQRESMEKTSRWIEEILSQPVKDPTPEELLREIQEIENEQHDSSLSVTSRAINDWLLYSRKKQYNEKVGFVSFENIQPRRR